MIPEIYAVSVRCEVHSQPAIQAGFQGQGKKCITPKGDENIDCLTSPSNWHKVEKCITPKGDDSHIGFTITCQNQIFDPGLWQHLEHIQRHLCFGMI